MTGRGVEATVEGRTLAQAVQWHAESLVESPEQARLLAVAEVMQRIRPLMDENALNTGAGRRQLLTEIRRLNDAVGL